jgi:hypothetical protein
MRWGLFVFERMMMKAIFACMVLLGCVAMADAQPFPRVLWQREGRGDSSAYGAEVYALGDQNNDGYADWAVLAMGGWHSHPGLINESYFELFHGGNPPSAVPYMVFRTDSNLASSYNAWEVVGDVNGDGYIDWCQINWDRINPTLIRHDFFWGGPQADTIPDWSWALGGLALVPVGDFNGDGYGDLACYHQTGDFVQIFFGGNPPDTIPDWTLHSPPGHPQEAWPASYGDLNGDGYGDIVTETLDPQYTYFFFGSAHPDTVPAQTWDGIASFSSAIVNDLNGDGRDDYVFPYFSHQVGVHWGRTVMSSTADAFVDAPCQGGRQWKSVGDINRDGYNDFVGFADYCDNSDFGALGIYLGHPWLYGPSRVIWPLTPPTNMMSFQSAAGLGDVNGDGLNDFLVGAYDDLAYIGWRGKAVIISGDTNLVADANEPHTPIPQELQVSVFPNPFNSRTTIALDLPAYSREVNLVVYNVLGQQVFRTTLNNVSVHTSYSLDASAFSSGIYLLHVSTSSLTATRKLMVLK